MTTTHDLSGRTAVITGATRGLGLEMGQAFASAGASIVVVSRMDAGRPIARTVKLFNAVVPGQWVLPLEAFPAQRKQRAEPVTEGIEARVLGWPGRGELQAPQQYVFLDKGRTEGVALGDLFEVES